MIGILVQPTSRIIKKLRHSVFLASLKNEF